MCGLYVDDKDVESKNPGRATAKKSGHFSGMRVFKDLGFAESPIYDSEEFL